MPLPPVTQVFAVQAGEFLAGVDAMIADTQRLADSTAEATGAAARMGATGDAAAAGMGAQAAAADRATAASGAYVDASGRLRMANGQFGTSAEKAALSADELAAAYDRAGVSAGAAGAGAEGAGAKTATAGSAMKTAFLGVGIAAVYGIDKAMKFQAAMAQLHTQAGVAQSKLAGLSQGVLQLASQVGEGPDSLAESLYHVASNMASTGASTAQMMDAVRVAAEGAQVGGADLVDVTNALGAAIASGIPGVEDYTKAMGMMNATVGSGDMHMQDLADAFGTGVLANIKLYGVTLQDVSAALATLGDNNIRGAVAGTDLRVAVQAMVQPAKSARAELANLGLSTKSFADAMKTGGLNGALQLLVTHMKAAGVTAKDQGQVITDLFGKKAGSGIGVLVGEFDRFKGKYAEVQKGADRFAGDWNSRSKTMQQQWNNLKAGVQALAISFGQLLLPAATKVVGIIGKFAGYLEAHPAVAKFAGALVALAVGFKIAAAAEALFNAVSDADPVLLVVMAIAALVFGLYELYKHCKTVRDIVHDVGQAFKAGWQVALKAADAVIRWFVNGPLAFIKAQVAQVTAWWAKNHAEIEAAARNVWHAISLVVSSAWHVLWDTVLHPGLVLLQAVWKVAWGVLVDTVKLVWGVVKAVVSAGVKVIEDIIVVAADILTGHWSKAWNDMKKLVLDAINGTTAVIKAFASGALRLLWDAGKNVVEGFLNGIKSMTGAVSGAAGDLGHAVMQGAKAALHIGSPSKKMHEVGENTAQGLADGIKAKHAAAVKAMEAIAKDLGAHFLRALAASGSAAAAAGGARQMGEWVKRAFAVGDISRNTESGLLSFLGKDNKRLQALAAQRQSIVATIAAAKSFAASTASDAVQWAGLSNVASNSTAGSMTYSGNLLAGMQANLSSIKAFGAAVAKLGKLGLRKDLISQIIAMGPDQGLQVAQSLIDGPLSVLKSMNSTQAGIVAASGALGKNAADVMYDSGAQAGKGFLSGLQAQQAAITKMMNQIAASMVTTVKKALKISSPSLVMAEHGAMVALGLAQGMQQGVPHVAAAALKLASAASGQPAGMAATAGTATGGTGDTHIHITVNGGLIGTQSAIAAELYALVQQGTLQHARRNGTNGLVLATA